MLIFITIITSLKSQVRTVRSGIEERFKPQKTLPLLSQCCYSTQMVWRPWFACCTCLIVLISNWWQNEVIFTLLFLSICHWHDRSCNWLVTNSSRGLTHNAHVCIGATMTYKRQPARRSNSMCMLPCWVRLNLLTLHTLCIMTETWPKWDVSGSNLGWYTDYF